MTEQQIDRLLTALERIAGKGGNDHLPSRFDFDLHRDVLAFRWKANLQNSGTFLPILSPQLIAFDSLKNIEMQKQRVYQNTQQFVQGLPANNILLSGARGTGKSSLIKACLNSFHQSGLRLIEVNKEHLDELPEIVEHIHHRPEKFIIFCDDLSFEEGDHHYQGLKTVLDGSTAGLSDNVLIYATSNRRHMVTEYMSDNLNTSRGQNGEIHPSDTIEEKISLSERFGIALHFYNFSQDEYLLAVSEWLSKYEYSNNDEALTKEAIQWATQRGGRSGRIAYQFVRDYVGRKRLEALSETS